ncbi:MAG: hypothetical protein ABIB46_06605, partial [bacterium]
LHLLFFLFFFIYSIKKGGEANKILIIANNKHFKAYCQNTFDNTQERSEISYMKKIKGRA